MASVVDVLEFGESLSEVDVIVDCTVRLWVSRRVSCIRYPKTAREWDVDDRPDSSVIGRRAQQHHRVCANPRVEAILGRMGKPVRTVREFKLWVAGSRQSNRIMARINTYKQLEPTRPSAIDLTVTEY